MENENNRKDDQIELLELQLKSQKKDYEEKIKNLMNSINLLKSKCSKIENESTSDARVNIIKELRNERKDQEYIISLLKKKLGNDNETDKYLLKEMANKLGENRAPTYEDMKIKVKQLEGEIVLLKKKNIPTSNEEENEGGFLGKATVLSGSTMKNNITSNVNAKSSSKSFMTNNYLKNKKNVKDDPQVKQLILSMKGDYEKEIDTYKEKVSTLESHIEIVQESNKRLENMQNDIFNKVKKYNSDVSEMKSIYENIKSNLEEEYEGKLNKFKQEISDNNKTIDLLRERLKEVIETSSKRTDEDQAKIEKLTSEFDLLKKILNGKKQEVIILEEELNRLKEVFDKQDSKDYMKIKKNERQADDVKLKLKECIEKNKYYEDFIVKKDFEIEQLKHTLEEFEEKCVDKDSEIELLQMKLEEMEELNLKHERLK